ncbi:conserved oligomeric Golgi complex subunit 7-like isoform X2 [Mercenaria mercenaria]|uniref:conserved oligomeric Golgi complex subunit 7-like isoform X2 n=1 Tax=Mercenaria mercenaria TaxID=6596 RepID=UPI00234E3D28|nr:conserved oligomeric Golgi complex subunit 7-like isoform X2 [Mercenaria mercenaria]
MDYTKFLDDEFDVKEWVNNAFSTSREQGVSKDQYATTLVMKLQMFIQEVNNVIEEASQQAIQNLPRVMREIEAVKQEASLLQDQMVVVKHDIQKVEHDTAQSMQTLLKLDSIKSRMTSAADALKEADNWTTLSADVEDVFQSQDIEAITSKLSGMQQSLQMLVDTPDYGERCQHLEKLKNRLEAMLSPQLMSAFNAQSIEAAQMFTTIFKSIDRLPQLYKFYNTCHKGTLLQSWKTLLETNADDSLVEWMNQLYDHLLSTWHSQMKWCGQIFPDPMPVVCQLITDTLGGLDPPLSQCFDTFVSQKGEPVPALIELKQISERFAKSIEKAAESHLKDTLEHTRAMECLLVMIYSPYTPYLVRYRTYEEQCLNNELNNIKMDHTEVFETVQLLSQSVSKLFSIANQADERCVKLTNGCCYVSLLQALKTYFSNYSKEFRRVLTNIKEKCKTSPGDLDSEDWSNFQHSLRVIQTCGDLIMHTEEFDSNVISNVMNTIGHLTSSGSPTKDLTSIFKQSTKKSPLHAQASLFLSNQDDIDALVAMVTLLQEGDTPALLTDSKDDMYKLSEEVHTFAFDVVFGQMKGYLTNLSIMEIWMSKSAGGALTSDLPTFSLSPQEYMTKIGQFLMTLPQHLEPFTMEDNQAVLVALKYGKLPYTDETGQYVINPKRRSSLPEHIADLWLESIARGTMHVLCEEIIRIHELSTHGTKQLITDIDYLCNVFDDLGIQATDTLKNIDLLLKANSETFHDIAENMPQRLAHAIGNMRHIDL